MRKISRDGGPGLDLHGLSICFDLDGTLVDTAPDLVRVTNEVVASRGFGPVDYRTARAAVGYGSRRMIIDALAAQGGSVDTPTLDAMQAEFLERYEQSMDQLSKPFHGVDATLSLMRSLGAELSVCTNKPGWLARPLMDKLGLDHHFVRIVGGDDLPRKKPSPCHIYGATGHRQRERIAMVGDSWPDMRAAQNAGVFPILMTYGYTPLPQKRLRAGARLSRFRDITPALLARYA